MTNPPNPTILIDLLPDLRRDLFGPARMARLAEFGEVFAPDRRLVAERRLEYDIVVTGWGSARFPDRLQPENRLRMIAHSAGTIRKVVPRTLLTDGVRVSQAASGMAVSVAELALYMTLSLMRNLAQVDRRMQRGDWAGASGFGLGRTIAGTRIGVIGASRVGRAYIEHLTGLGAEVVVTDPYLTRRDAEEMGVQLCDLDELLRSCAVVALHAPVTDETRGMLTAQRLSLIPNGGILVNTARSAVLDSGALLSELRSGRLSAALDVYDVEPLPADDPLWTLPNVLLTPHIGALTTHSRAMQGDVVVDEIDRFVAGAPLVFEVTDLTYDRLA
ncbi:hydroxyacid dehydrogenase [Occultella kanbiaonis]|uniref:hydroxyacid dehydrogenase n=1 Tax=Occultella kanbiaonis TaxID=2675754 RepID=UPI0012B70B2A|nr:hydroxyacid dehydrogenase [Occultella kanbiaonis]